MSPSSTTGRRGWRGARPGRQCGRPTAPCPRRAGCPEVERTPMMCTGCIRRATVLQRLRLTPPRRIRYADASDGRFGRRQGAGDEAVRCGRAGRGTHLRPGVGDCGRRRVHAGAVRRARREEVPHEHVAPRAERRAGARPGCAARCARSARRRRPPPWPSRPPRPTATNSVRQPRRPTFSATPTCLRPMARRSSSRAWGASGSPPGNPPARPAC
jgi:hypothetical protein